MRYTGLGILFSLVASAVGLAAENHRPNVVFILADDLGWADVGCNGGRFYETPNIDRLAAGGMRFTSAYAAGPVCSPTRASIMAGRYPARMGITEYIGGNRSAKLLPPKTPDHMALEEVTFAEAMKDAGYRTALIGKWHLGGKGFWPQDQGFDVNIGGGPEGSPPTYFSPYRLKNLADGPAGEYLNERLTSEAVRFMEANRDKPFLIYLSHYAVHIPRQAKPETIAKYRRKLAGMADAPREKFRAEGKSMDNRVQDDPVYAAMVDSLDESVGRITLKLEELGIANNTIVIFFSDNGGLSTAEGQPTSNAPLRAGKGWLYEGGIREPMIVKWPTVTKPGSTCDQAVTSTDFYPTILEMAGAAQRPQQSCDGVSFVPLLKQSGDFKREPIYWHYPHYSNQGGKPAGAVRDGDWKLIEFYEDDRMELYNVKEDIGERHDLAGKMPEKAAKLREQLRAWRKSIGAKMPEANPGYKADAGSLKGS